MHGADLRNAEILQMITGIQLQAAGDVTGVNLSGNDMFGLEFSGVNLAGADFKGGGI